jgi:lipoprotein-anchoring transpeptidase ErfK/SrfK
MRTTTTAGLGSLTAVLTVLGVTVGLGGGAVAPATVSSATIGAAGPVGTVAPVAALPVAAPAPRTAATTAATARRSAPAATRSSATDGTRPGRHRASTSSTSGATRVADLPCELAGVGDGVCVQLSTQRAWLVRDGRVVLSLPVTTGKAGHRTPTGRFSVLSKDADYVSREFDAPMPWSVFFSPGIAFHTGSLSQRSHGCVHLSNATAKTFFSTLHRGDTVVVVR